MRRAGGKRSAAHTGRGTIRPRPRGFASVGSSVSTAFRPAAAAALAAGIVLAGCSTIRANLLGDAPAGPTEGTPGFVSGFLGGVVADEPRAALAGRDALSAGGDAADAAVATILMLGVTLPSRAGLGGGGACLAYDPKPRGPGGGAPEAILFQPQAPAHPGPGDRPAAVPLMARGLFALHAKYGHLAFEQLTVPAEQAARFGVSVSEALARDLAVVAGPLAGDPVSAGIFLPGGRPLAAGDPLRQPDLATSLSTLRTAGVGTLYQGLLAKTLAAAASDAGGGLSAEDFRAALPSIAAPQTLPAGNDLAAFLPAAADGGAAAAAFGALRRTPGDLAVAQAQAVAAAAQARGRGTLPALSASTTVVALDRDGRAVVCALTMDNLFGTGRIAPGTGILLAASPAAFPPPLLSAGLAYNAHIHAFRAAAAGSGQEGAALAAASALAQALADPGPRARPLPAPPPEPGRANVMECPGYLPGDRTSCGWATDPRGAGLGLGSS